MSSIHTSKLKAALERHAQLSDARLRRRHPAAADWFETRSFKPHEIRHHAGRLMSAAALAGTMLMGSPAISSAVKTNVDSVAGLSAHELQIRFADSLKARLPDTVRPLSTDEESELSRLINAFWGIRASGTLEGEHLNTTYGYMGAEQHLPRYPGDAVSEHDGYPQSGMTPGKGAWGYFAGAKGELTDDLVQNEKYYVAVQTLYLPDWQSRLPYLREWYKYRKVLVANPANGKTIVADVADSGPSFSTGKSFGASPEVMAYLEMKDGAQRGPAVLFFIDDPDNIMPLGPVEKRRE